MNYSRKFVKLTLVLSIVLSFLLFISRNAIIKFFNLEPETSVYLSKTLAVYSLYFTPKMFTYMFICGILRAGGDTRFCMFLDMVTIWLMGVPLSFFSVLVLHLPIHLVIAVVFSEEIIKMVIILKRYKSRKWLNNLIMD